jgi:cell division protein FtsB
MLNTLGMSESILKLIEKRSRTDLLIFFVMAVLTLLLIIILIYFVKPWLSGASTAAAGEV